MPGEDGAFGLMFCVHLRNLSIQEIYPCTESIHLRNLSIYEIHPSTKNTISIIHVQYNTHPFTYNTIKTSQRPTISIDSIINTALYYPSGHEHAHAHAQSNMPSNPISHNRRKVRENKQADSCFNFIQVAITTKRPRSSFLYTIFPTAPMSFDYYEYSAVEKSPSLLSLLTAQRYNLSHCRIEDLEVMLVIVHEVNVPPASEIPNVVSLEASAAPQARFRLSFSFSLALSFSLFISSSFLAASVLPTCISMTPPPRPIPRHNIFVPIGCEITPTIRHRHRHLHLPLPTPTPTPRNIIHNPQPPPPDRHKPPTPLPPPLPLPPPHLLQNLHPLPRHQLFALPIQHQVSRIPLPKPHRERRVRRVRLVQRHALVSAAVQGVEGAACEAEAGGGGGVEVGEDGEFEFGGREVRFGFWCCWLC